MFDTFKQFFSPDHIAWLHEKSNDKVSRNYDGREGDEESVGLRKIKRFLARAVESPAKLAIATTFVAFVGMGGAIASELDFVSSMDVPYQASLQYVPCNFASDFPAGRSTFGVIDYAIGDVARFSYSQVSDSVQPELNASLGHDGSSINLTNFADSKVLKVDKLLNLSINDANEIVSARQEILSAMLFDGIDDPRLSDLFDNLSNELNKIVPPVSPGQWNVLDRADKVLSSVRENRARRMARRAVSIPNVDAVV